MTLGTPVSGTIANPGDEATYTFTGSPGQRIYFNSLASPTYYVFAQLTDPNGNSIFNNSEEYNEGPYTLTYAGTYTLTVYSYGTQRGTGNYSFALDDVTSPTASVALTAGRRRRSAAPSPAWSRTSTSSAARPASGSTSRASPTPLRRRPRTTSTTPPTATSSTPTRRTTARSPCRRPAPTSLTSPARAPANTSVSYKFEVFENVNPTTGLTLGTPVSGTIANPGDEATYTFTGSPGQRIYFNSLASPTYYVFAQLTDPNGNSIFNNSEEYNEGPYTLTYAGTYTLTVYSYGTQRGTGNYSFALDDVTSPTSSVALTPGAGTTVSGTLSGLGTNFYQLSGTAGERLYFQGISDSVSDATRYNLYNATSGNILNTYTENDGTVTLPATGTYLLDVAGKSASNASVNYKFEVFENVDPTAPLTLGTPASGTIANPGDEATYTFTGSPGQRIYVNGLDAYIANLNAVLYDPNGNTIFNNNASYNEGPYTLTYAGTYTLTVYSSGVHRATGDYSIAVDDVTSPTASVALTAGAATPVSGTLSGLIDQLLPAQRHGRRAALLPGHLRLRLGGRSVQPLQRRQQQHPQQLGRGRRHGHPAGHRHLPARRGRPDAANTSVNYAFKVFENVDPTAGLTLGKPVSGAIANPGDEATYTFTGSPGQQIYFDALGSSTANLNAILTDPYGNTIFNNNASYDEGPYTLTWGGTYTLTVYSSGTSRATGSYAFEMLDESAQPLTPTATATSVSGTLTPGHPDEHLPDHGDRGPDDHLDQRHLLVNVGHVVSVRPQQPHRHQRRVRPQSLGHAAP